MSGPLDNCGLRREVVYADKEVVDMLEDKDAEITRLRAELAEVKAERDVLHKQNVETTADVLRLGDELAAKDELIREAMEALEYISRKASHGNLYGDEARDMCCDIGPVAQEVLARLREKEGGK